MRDAECIEFLQWALPRLRLRWAGYRKVRAQVCKRAARRLKDLGLAGIRDYRAYLERTPAEWAVLDHLCPVTVTRFWRDKAVFDFLAQTVLPTLAHEAALRSQQTLKAWSIGCANGEEPYSLMLAWRLGAPRARETTLRVLATDIDETLVERARTGCYTAGSLKLLPPAWLARAFEGRDRQHCLRAEFQDGVAFDTQDIRTTAPQETFDLILCRNLAFTYFDESLQREVLARIRVRLRAGGALALGRHESPPPGAEELAPWPGGGQLGVYRRA